MAQRHSFKILVSLCLFLGFLSTAFGGCGRESADTPEETATAAAAEELTISSVMAGSVSLSSSATTSSVSKETSFVVTFSGAMDESTVTSDTLTLTDISDGGSNTLAGTIAANGDKTAFTFTPSENVLGDAIFGSSTYQFVVIGGAEGVKDGSGNTLSETLTYTFTTACTSSDAFESSSSNICYTFRNTGNQTNESEAATNAADIIINGEGNGKLRVDFSTTAVDWASHPAGDLASLYKHVSGDFTVEVTVESITIDGTINPQIGFAVDSSLVSGRGGPDSLTCTHSPSNCNVSAIRNNVFDPTSSGNVSCIETPFSDEQRTVSSGVTLRLSRSGQVLTCAYRTATASTFTTIGAPLTLNSLPSDVVLGIMGTSGSSSSGTGAFVLDNLLFTSGGATGQE